MGVFLGGGGWGDLPGKGLSPLEGKETIKQKNKGGDLNTIIPK